MNKSKRHAVTQTTLSKGPIRFPPTVIASVMGLYPSREGHCIVLAKERQLPAGHNFCFEFWWF